MSRTIPLLIFVFIIYAFKGDVKNAQYTLSKEKNELIFTASFNAKMMHDILVKAKKCDEDSRLTQCIDGYLKENIVVMADSAVAKLSFMSSSKVNSALVMKYRLNRVPADFNQLIIKNTVMNDEQPGFVNLMLVQLGKKPKEYRMTAKKSIIELKL